MLPDLLSDRLRLSELCAAHFDPMQLLMDSSGDDGGVSSVGERETAAERVAGYETHRGPDTARRFFVYSAFSDDTMVGTVSLVRAGHPLIATLGLFVGAQHRGHSFGTEMVSRMLAFGFDDLGLHRVEADVEIGNVASQRVMERAGLLREGVMRDCTFARGRWWTDIKYAVLASDDQRRSAKNWRNSAAASISARPP